MNTSESTKNLFVALGAFQDKMPVMQKDTINPFFKKNYATLDSIQKAARPILKEAGLTYTQHPGSDYSLTTRVVHVDSGEWMESSYSMTPTKAGPQEVGSLISYQKRYALQAILGIIVTDEDDDGNKAQGKKEVEPYNMAPPGQPVVTEQERSRIVKELNKYEDVDKMRTYFSGLAEKLRADDEIIKASVNKAKSLKK